MTVFGKIITVFLVLIAIAAISISFFSNRIAVVIEPVQGSVSSTVGGAVKKVSLEVIPERDIENQTPLTDPPKAIKAIYLTSWSAGGKRAVDYAIGLVKRTDINAVVIDIKDYSGFVAYDTGYEPAKKYGAVQIRIPKINSLIKKLHDERIYVIARITAFQDPVFANARPDLAVQSVSKFSSTTDPSKYLWQDRKGLPWIDPASKDAWDYIVGIGEDARGRGFDELNFDYIRFPSDGNLDDAKYPFWDQKTSRNSVMRSFFKYLRERFPNVRISADLFGLTTVAKDDQGIGQIIEDAGLYFDYVAPMIYPSHYASGFWGYKNPAAHPYEIVKNSMDSAIAKLYGTSTATSSFPAYPGKLRPWLQDFDLGAVYDSEMVKLQIKAVEESMGDRFEGYMLWSPDNLYSL